MADNKKSVLFVCLGNICRSPIAEAVFNSLLKEQKAEGDWVVDSAAIGPWHVGEQPDTRTFKVLGIRGINNYTHVVRQITTEDFEKFHFIFGMDEENIKALNQKQPKDFKGSVELLGSYDPQGELKIRDPYYDNDDKGFRKCYDQCRRSLVAFLEKQKSDKSESEALA